MKKKNTTLKQNLSKDMKKQNYVSKRKPNNGKLSSEKELSETPKKGSYREPSSKKLSSEKFLSKSKMTHIKEFNNFDVEINEEINLGKISFEDVMNSNWEKTYPYDADGPGAKTSEGVVFTMSHIWDEFKPLAHSLSKEDQIKLYNVLFYSREMFNHIKSTDNSNEIIQKIISDKNMPEGG